MLRIYNYTRWWNPIFLGPQDQLSEDSFLPQPLFSSSRKHTCHGAQLRSLFWECMYIELHHFDPTWCKFLSLTGVSMLSYQWLAFTYWLCSRCTRLHTINQAALVVIQISSGGTLLLMLFLQNTSWSLGAIKGILAIRTYALYERSRRILLFLAAMCTCAIAIGIVSSTFHSHTCIRRNSHTLSVVFCRAGIWRPLAGDRNSIRLPFHPKPAGVCVLLDSLDIAPNLGKTKNLVQYVCR